MGRMAAYTGQSITWDMALNSQEDLTPPAYDWNVPMAVLPVAMPGLTKLCEQMRHNRSFAARNDASPYDPSTF